MLARRPPHHLPRTLTRLLSTTSTTTSTSPQPPPPPPPPPPSLKPSLRPLTPQERLFLTRALRVNQAGELGANLIYSGQYSVLRHDPRLKPLIRHMWDQESHHLSTFDALLARHRVRPTALRPVWNVAGWMLGWTTARLGEKAAMACTEAVETEIGGHYNGQVRVLLDMLADGDGKEGEGEGEGKGGKIDLGRVDEETGGELRGLLEVIRRFRDEELEHLDTAVEHDSQGAGGYEVLTGVIRAGCRVAIALSSRV